MLNVTLWPIITYLCILLYKRILLPYQPPYALEVITDLIVIIFVFLLSIERKSRVAHILQTIILISIILLNWLYVYTYIALNNRFVFDNLNFSSIGTLLGYITMPPIIAFTVIVSTIGVGLKYTNITLRLNSSTTYSFVYVMSLACAILYMYFNYNSSYSYELNYFDDLKGPKVTTVIPAKIPTSIKQYSQGTESRLAILLTDRSTLWLGLAHGLKSIGVPFIITENYQEALKHKVVFIYPAIPRDLPVDALDALMNFPLKGGTLITKDIYIDGMNQVFGIDGSLSAKTINSVHINQNFSVTQDFTVPEEQNIRIRNANGLSPAEVAYSNPIESPLATYENGTAAIVQKTYPNGKAYAIGINIGRLALIGYDNKQDGISPYYVNHYVPTIDVFLRLIKNIYLEREKNAVTLNTVPDGKSLAVLLTHDICFSSAYDYLETYAEYEHAQNINATYFITTKYIRDFLDIAYFNKANIEILKKIINMGMALGSHSLSHSLQFNKFPLGKGNETYPTYTPHVVNNTLTNNGSILGELRISRFLLQHFFPTSEISAFRPGYMRNPWALPESLTATGFSFSSSVTANDSLTHLPFQLSHGRDYSSALPVFEFPITIEDRELPEMYDRLPEAIAIANKLKRYGGLFVILIHPDIIGKKFKFETEFVRNMGDSVWYGTINDFGKWWAARNEIGIDVSTSGKNHVVALSVPLAISGLTLNIPSNWHYISSNPVNINVSQREQQVIIKQLTGDVKLYFE